ncbi:hypothetical protein CERZMDRAFT_100940 [Cercospora zeae-maydis SCOH1-5]|uniref:Apple domain-containing protein n=1 Tax=Cercospora zeae-maydis SCOH1-5 TaxID=717836 RepID=A0A6A6F839_9PEZI|nr:hypothetical protein CERZMDRAFT_100940 [Cercospora zeae-maydis SCOH1-5]
MDYALLILSWISATSAQRSFSDFPENWRATATNTPTIPTCEPATGIYSNAACPIATTFWNGDVYHYANPYMFSDNSWYGGETAWSTCNIDDCALWCEQSGSQCLGWGYTKFECICKKFMVAPLREAYWNDWGSDITAFLRITGYNFTGQPGGPPVPATSTLLGAGSPSAGFETVVVATTTPGFSPAVPLSSTSAVVSSSEAVIFPVPIPDSSTSATAASASAAVPAASLPQPTSSSPVQAPSPSSATSSSAPVQLDPSSTRTAVSIPPQSPSLRPSPASPAPTICPAANAALTTLNNRAFQITCNAAHCGATATYSGTGAAITNLASCIAQCTGSCTGLYFTSGLCMEIVGGGSRCPYDMRGYTAAYVVGAAPTASAGGGGGGGLLGLGLGGLL